MKFWKKKKAKAIKIKDEAAKIPKELVSSKELHKYVYGKDLPKVSLKYLRFVYDNEFKANKVLLIRMFLRNGKMTEFTTAPDKPLFTYSGGMYVIDNDYIVDDVGSGYRMLIYHQDLSIPLRIAIDIDAIKSEINEDEAYNDIVENLNPITLMSVIRSNVIQKVMAGAELEGTFRMLLYFAIGNSVGLFMILMIFGYFIFRT